MGCFQLKTAIYCFFCALQWHLNINWYKRQDTLMDHHCILVIWFQLDNCIVQLFWRSFQINFQFPIFSDKVILRISKTKSIPQHNLPFNNPRDVANCLLRDFKLIWSILDIRGDNNASVPIIIILWQYMPLINRVINGCCPIGIPPISLSDDIEKHKKNATLQKGSAKNEKAMLTFLRLLFMDLALLLSQQKLTPF